MQPAFRAVFGTRAVKCTDLSERLKQIYQNNWRLYLTSKYGGMLLSVLTLFLYNRYVTDILSSVKAFDAHLLRSLDLQSNGIDLERRSSPSFTAREYMFELPVEYKPRPRTRAKRSPPGMESRPSSRSSDTASPGLLDSAEAGQDFGPFACRLFRSSSRPTTKARLSGRC